MLLDGAYGPVPGQSCPVSRIQLAEELAGRGVYEAVVHGEEKLHVIPALWRSVRAWNLPERIAALHLRLRGTTSRYGHRRRQAARRARVVPTAGGQW